MSGETGVGGGAPESTDSESSPIGAKVTSDRLSREPYPLLADLRSSAPVCWIPDLDCWMVTSYEHAVTVMSNAGTFTVDHPGFSTQQVIGPSMLSLDGVAHRMHRDPFTAPFRLRAIRSEIASWIDARADELVAAVEPDGSADLREAVARPLAVETMARMLGLDGIGVDEVVAWYSAIVEAVHSVTMGSGVTDEGRNAFAELAEAVIQSMVTSPLLKVVRAEGELTPEEIASNVAVLLFGGIVTGDGTNSMVLQHLLGVDGLVDHLTAHSDEVGDMVDESLRLEPAAAAVDRYATRDVELGGVTIAAGDLVRVSLTAANRDSTVFPDPDTFDMARDNLGRHLTFARGPHACLGAHLARAEAVAIVRAVLSRLRRPALVRRLMVEPEGLVFRGLERVPVEWQPGKTSTTA